MEATPSSAAQSTIRIAALLYGSTHQRQASLVRCARSSDKSIHANAHVRTIGENGFMFLTDTKTHNMMDNNHSAVSTGQMP